ncbi:MAG: DUF3078 domain-containing protein [Bacteroidales bacterium]
MKLRFLITLVGFLNALTIFSQDFDLNLQLTFPDQNELLLERQYPDTVPVNTLFMPLVFRGEVLPHNMKLIKHDEPKAFPVLDLPMDISWLTKAITLDSLRGRAKLYAAVVNPYVTRYYINRLPSKKELDEIEREATKASVPTLFSPEEIQLPKNTAGLQKVKEKQSFWKNFSVANLQFTQNYISRNWHQGGESNISLLSNFNWKFQYRDAKNIQFDNEVDWRSGFFSTPSDTLRMFKVSDDQLRLSSKFGYKAFEKWYYTASFEFKTKLFNSYNTNSKDMLSSILTPAEAYFSLGMDLKTKINKPNIQNLSVFIAPLSYSMKYALRDKKVDVTRFGIQSGKKTLHQVGSMVKASMNFPITKNIQWDSRFYYFTSYSNVESEWENSVNFILNRYFSTRVFFIVRYDDRRALIDEDDSFFQWKEFLSLGFTYRW